MKRLLPVLILALVLSTACAGDPSEAPFVNAFARPSAPTTVTPYTGPASTADSYTPTTTTTRPPVTTTTAYAYPNGWSDQTATNFLEAFEDSYRASAGRAPDQAWTNCAGAAVMLRWSPAEADRLAARGDGSEMLSVILDQCGSPR